MVFGCVATAGVIGIAAWRVPMNLPGHRVLGWLALLVAARLIAGRGWAAIVGVCSAIGVLVFGIGPGGVWGVAQYAVAGALVDLVLWGYARPFRGVSSPSR